MPGKVLTHVAVVLGAVIALSGGSATAPAAAPTTVPSATASLAAAGLVNVGNLYLLDADARIADGLKAMRLAKARQDAYAAKRGQLEASVVAAEADLAEINVRWRTAMGQLGKANRKTKDYNDNVSRTNALQTQSNDAEREVRRRQKALDDLPVVNDDYVGEVIALADRLDAAAARYESLAADKTILAALATANKTAKPPAKLGPSPRFTQELPIARRLRDSVMAEAVPCRVGDTNVPVVTVVLNETAPVPMLWDSGASTISLTDDVARHAGIVVGKDDPTTKIHIASGAVVEGRVTKVRSVRVGQFVARDVTCVVMPESMRNAPLLLGNTFQRNFIARVNLGAKRIHLTPLNATATADAVPKGNLPGAVVPGPVAVGPKPAADPNPAAGGKGDGGPESRPTVTTRPSTPPPSQASTQPTTEPGPTTTVTAGPTRLERLRTFAARPAVSPSPLPLTIAEPVRGDVTWPINDAGYKISDTVSIGRNERGMAGYAGKVTAAAGFILEGGTIHVARGELQLSGQPDRPVILRKVAISSELGCTVRARHVVFEDCTFSKGGRTFSANGFSSKWAFEDCLLRNSNFAVLKRTDFGLQIRRCSFVDCSLPPRALIDKSGDAEVDAAEIVKLDQNEVASCDFYRCRVAASATWYMRSCNLYDCSVSQPATAAVKTDLAVTIGVGPGDEGTAATLKSKTTVTGSGKIGYAAASSPFVTAAFPAD